MDSFYDIVEENEVLHKNIDDLMGEIHNQINANPSDEFLKYLLVKLGELSLGLSDVQKDIVTTYGSSEQFLIGKYDNQIQTMKNSLDTFKGKQL